MSRSATASPVESFPPTRLPGHGRRWYRGDCHVHSVLSNGGELSPAQLVAGARAVSLDFLVTTEHNRADGHGSWAEHLGPDLLVVLGQEATTPAGHWLALGVAPGQLVGWDYGVDDDAIGQELDGVREVGGICVVAHPFAPYPTGTFSYPYSGFDAVEVWNGQWASDEPWQADNEAALAMWADSLSDDVGRRRWRPAVGGSDTHLAGQIGVPHTVVLAHELSSRAILGALGAGHSWIAGSQHVDLAFTVTVAHEVAGIGQRLVAVAAGPTARIQVRGVPSGTVSLLSDDGLVHRVSLPDSGAGLEVCDDASLRSARFLRVEVRDHLGHMAALTNPIPLA
jgi:predicted metal-dependent phosphoesterase TrpH